MGRLVFTSFVTLDGVMEAPGHDEHRSGRNAWALRVSDCSRRRSGTAGRPSGPDGIV
jgi:hypothetical protein